MNQQIERIGNNVRALLVTELRPFVEAGLMAQEEADKVVNGTKEAVQLLNEQFAGLVAESVRAKLQPHVRRQERGNEPTPDQTEHRERRHELDHGGAH